MSDVLYRCLLCNAHPRDLGSLPGVDVGTDFARMQQHALEAHHIPAEDIRQAVKHSLPYGYGYYWILPDGRAWLRVIVLATV